MCCSHSDRSSAAFDTVDHVIMLDRLNKYLGITCTALEWFRSYLSTWKVTVNVQGASSTQRDVKYRVPQGSVLGPFLFSLYSLPLGGLIKSHHNGCTFYMFFTDDWQIYLYFEPQDPHATHDQLESLIQEIGRWLVTNCLNRNDEKTEMLLSYSIHHPPPIFPPLQVGESIIHPSDLVHNLVVLFNATMSMEQQITSIVFCFIERHV